MNTLGAFGLIAIGVALFTLVLAVRMVQANIAPKWLTRLVAPPKRS